MLCKEGVLSLRCHASSLLLHRMLWWKKVCYPLPCKLAAVVIQCSGKKGCAIPAAAAARCCWIHRMPGGRVCAIPPCHMQAAVVITECSGGVKGVLSLLPCELCCCCDPQNALWKKGVLSLRCHVLLS
jgi:hypothetical protein